MGIVKSMFAAARLLHARQSRAAAAFFAPQRFFESFFCSVCHGLSGQEHYRVRRGRFAAFTWQGLFFIICNCRTIDVVATGASACGQAPDTTTTRMPHEQAQ